jgi:hypothetical protein
VPAKRNVRLTPESGHSRRKVATAGSGGAAHIRASAFSPCVIFAPTRLNRCAGFPEARVVPVSAIVIEPIKATGHRVSAALQFHLALETIDTRREIVVRIFWRRRSFVRNQFRVSLKTPAQI